MHDALTAILCNVLTGLQQSYEGLPEPGTDDKETRPAGPPPRAACMLDKERLPSPHIGPGQDQEPLAGDLL